MTKKDAIYNVTMLALFTASFGAFCAWRLEVVKPYQSVADIAAEKETEEVVIEEEEKDYYSAFTLPTYSIIPESLVIETSFETIEATTYAETSEEATETPETTMAVEITEPETESATAQPETTEPQPETTEAQPFLRITPNEQYLMLKTASCEAGGQGVEGLALVMRVILNRSALYGCSITDVIYAPGQFAVVGNEQWNSEYIVQDAYTALAMVQNGWDGSMGATYFCLPSHNSWHRSALTFLFKYGDHEFYR